MIWRSLLLLAPPVLTWLAFNAFAGWQRYRRTRTWVAIPGLVTSRASPTAGRSRVGLLLPGDLRVRYAPLGEKEMQLVGRTPIGFHRPGRPVPVRYNPQRPGQAILDNAAENGLAPVLHFVALLLAALAAVARILPG